MKSKIFKAISTIFPVFLGVLFALFINSWKTDYDNKRYVKKILFSITMEMTENMESLERVMPLHEALLDSTVAHLDNSEASIRDIISGAGGLKGILIKNVSWHSFLNSKIELVEYEMISALADIDKSRELLDLKMNKLMDFVYEHSESTDRSKKEMLIAFIDNLIDSEESLRIEHENFLKEGNLSDNAK